MPKLVTIPISHLEIVGYYADPQIEAVDRRVAVVRALLNSFREWGVGIENIEEVTEGKFVDKGVLFTFPGHRITFFSGAAFFRLAQDGSGWQNADIALSVIEAAMTALHESAGYTLRSFKATSVLHLQPKSVGFLDIIMQFMPPQLAGLETGSQIRTVASVVVWENRRITIDGSASLANAIFVKLERDFEDTLDLKEMEKQLRDDEQELLKVLDVEEEQ